MTPVELARFEEKVSPEPTTGCWLWTGAAIRQGYGYARANGRTRRAHRAIVEHRLGRELPPDVYVCHRCDNPACVNPDHLWLGTNADNMRDKQQKGRCSRNEQRSGAMRSGAEHYNAKLTPELIEQVRAAYGGPLSNSGRKNGVINPRSLTGVAARFGISVDTVRRIHARKTWLD
jgi:hypothetical protein